MKNAWAAALLCLASASPAAELPFALFPLQNAGSAAALRTGLESWRTAGTALARPVPTPPARVDTRSRLIFADGDFAVLAAPAPARDGAVVDTCDQVQRVIDESRLNLAEALEVAREILDRLDGASPNLPEINRRIARLNDLRRELIALDPYRYNLRDRKIAYNWRVATGDFVDRYARAVPLAGFALRVVASPDVTFGFTLGAGAVEFTATRIASAFEACTGDPATELIVRVAATVDGEVYPGTLVLNVP